MSRPAKMQRRAAPLHFTCSHCSGLVAMGAPGTEHRNHCPICLWSHHVDRTPGDRQCACHGQMEPVAIWVRPDGEWAIVHRCQRCSTLRSNRIAGDDDPSILMKLASRPLFHPAFPIAADSPEGGAR